MWITTWNLNGIRARTDRLLTWIELNNPPILCLQELKSEILPKEVTNKFKYIALSAEKGKNGVAILSKYKIKNIETVSFLGNERRVIAGTIKGVRIVNVYVPQGYSDDGVKYKLKLEWLMSFYFWLKGQGENIIILGDFNICPTSDDVYDPTVYNNSVISCTEPERSFFQMLQSDFKLIDAVRSLTKLQIFTYWSYLTFYKMGLEQGIRIDHVLHSDNLFATEYEIDTGERLNYKGASDHAPLSVNLKLISNS